MSVGGIASKAFMLLLAAGFAGPLSAQARAQSPDVGLVNMVSGDVAYRSEGAAAGKVQAFMKVRQGDRFTVPAGSQVRIVYFQGGRQETWRGPAAFRAGSRESDPSSGQPVAVNTLPAGVPQKISQVPELVQIARLGRSGGVAVRGAGRPPRLSSEQQAEVAAARDTYKRMRLEASNEDITPELYLYTVLQDYLLYEDMKPVVAEMAKRQPHSAEVKELASWVKSRTE